jgi:hypothetical protein
MTSRFGVYMNSATIREKDKKKKIWYRYRRPDHPMNGEGGQLLGT